jgi:PAS domain S-box-containing protein
MNKYRIIVIEDNAGVISVLKQHLLTIGYADHEVLFCSNLMQAGETSNTDPECIITGLSLSGSPGKNSIHALLLKFPQVPVIVLTDFAEISGAIEAIESGAEDYLVNGEFNHHDLQKTIRLARIRKGNAHKGRLFDESPLPMYTYDDLTFEFLEVNQAALRQYGYTREEFLSINAKQIRPPEEIAAFTSANLDVPETYFDFGQWKHIRKSGEIFFVHIYAHTTDFEGKKARFVLAVDIDEKVKAEVTVSQKNAEIINILESITDGFYAVNKNWEVTYFNKTAEQVLGCKREEVLGKNLWEFFPRSREGEFYSEYLRAMTEKVSVHFEEQYAPLGVWGAMNVYPTEDGIAVYFVDITEQKKIQEQIFNDQQNLRAIINNTSDIIWSVGLDYNIISANQAFWDRLETITGKRSEKFSKEDYDEEFLGRWQQFYERAFTGEAFKTILEQRYEGKDRFEEVSFNPIRDIKNQVNGISCFSRDITTEYLHLRTIERQNGKLREIAWIQSHEVRSPLASIMGIVPLFNHQNTADPVNSQLLNMIAEASVRLDTIIRKINDKAQDIDDGLM